MMDWLNGLLDGSLVSGGVFLVLGIIGAILLLLSLLLDGLFDIFDFGDGPLSLTTIAAFTTIFGFTAFALVGSGLDTPIAGVLGAVAGLFGGLVAWWLARVMRNAESTTSVTTTELRGLEGVVVLAIPGGAGFGEVALTRHGERVSLAASAERAIPRGTRVTIIETLTPTSVLVAESNSATGEPQPSDQPDEQDLQEQ